MKRARELGFVGALPIDAWVRSRALRLSVLACVKIARTRENAPTRRATRSNNVSPILKLVAALPDALIRELIVPFVGLGL